ncbi:nanoRNase/pAp phosphatase, hydrolyzes c-di-AMP and oligoRNAs [Haladaptatus litoreus]|uniref:NanoRNase/pAp phosphatase, hydrolyzes c-di-AMP and oligoRNAs n=1 Tax=Haladaptatus litoreus TaxID=553468 RepID=A0A1N7D132_9EURY|nr:DHHA1 domain-containing protein [Haladaptatus litoreus]SIR69405.1 nanoRNase/pAp phosphatase, hydrolyzes c-di-AMP and oligoRNAs [Haladaptatus litoreus]
MGKSDELYSRLKDVDSVAIVCHYQPDPDCLASAFAFQWIAEQAEVDQATIFYEGEITHQEIRSFINVFEISLERIQEENLREYDCIALIDHAVSGKQVDIPDDIPISFIIDTQDIENSSEATFVDSRADYGTTSTILTEYITEQEWSPSTPIMSALLFAIHHERLDHVRYPTLAEYEAATVLYPAADIDLIEEVYGSSLTPSTLDAIGRAINHREKHSSTLVSSIGRTTESGSLPQAADYLLRLEGVRTVLVMGIVDGHLRLSAQSFDPRIDIGNIIKQSFGSYGSAGGHPDRAGGQLPLGIFAESSNKNVEIEEQLFKVVASRFFGTLNLDEE